MIFSRTIIPRSIVWEVTGRCNQTCAHCYNVWTKPGASQPSDLPTESMFRIIDALKPVSKKIRGLSFTGGEPLLRDDIETVITTAHRQLPKLSLILATNGQRLNVDAANRLKTSGISTIQLSLLSSKPDVHDEMTGLPGSFESVMRAIASARSAGLPTAVFFVATKRNIADFTGAAKLAVALGANGIVFNRFQPGGRGLRDWRALTPTRDQLLTALDHIRALRKITSVSLGTMIPPCESDGKEPDMRCPVGTRNGYPAIGPDGSVRPCNHASGIAGNILDTPLMEILKSPVMKRGCFTNASAVCEKCDKLKRCRVGCPAAHIEANGHIYTPEA